MTRGIATLVGTSAIGMWALLALFTVGAAEVPPFQRTAFCFTVASLIGLGWGAASGTLGELRAVPWRVALFGAAGLFGYHALYFFALRTAPPAGAGLIAYLWPLLIVLFSGLLPGERLRTGHILGAVAGFAGAAAILLAGRGSGLGGLHLGYGLALGCALVWSGYSVLSRRARAVPSIAVTLYCALSAAAALVFHLALEETVWPATTGGWLSMAGLALGPVGLAFFTWDVGVKRGDIQLLGVLSYAAPVLSTLALVVVGMAEPSAALFLATALITGGAALAARA